jgi:hypothetical protein
VAGVQFRLNCPGTACGNVGAEDTSSPYTGSLNTTTLGNGTHTISATARDAAGNTTTSSVITITVNNPPPPSDTTPPSVPANLRKSSATTTSITLAWDASTDSGTGVASYNVYRNAVFLTNTTQLSYTNSGLTPGTSYTYSVSALDNANPPNQSAQTAGLAMSTNSNPPTVTIAANPTSLASGASSILTWSTTGATACTASGSWSGSKATSGTQTISGITASATYTLTCTGPGGSANASASVTVGSIPPPPPPPPTPTYTKGDINKDGSVSVIDLSILLTKYGAGATDADIDTSGHVDVIDLSILLSNYGK